MNTNATLAAHPPAAAIRPPAPELLPSIDALAAELPLSPALAAQVAAHRQAVRNILAGSDPRLLVVVGPCSIHDVDAAMDYAHRLRALSDQLGDKLLLVMRVYVEKPRTTVGWKGLLYDPALDGSHDMALGLRTARRLMRDIVALGLPVATELLHPMAAGYLEDLLSWAAVGARTTESQIHREMVSGLSLPCGFKNGTDGGTTVAIDAMGAAARGHHHFGVDRHGRPAVLVSDGNADTHLVLRGGRSGPNYHADALEAASNALANAGVSPALMVDCSHANSQKDHRRQIEVLKEVLAQRRAGRHVLRAVMIESHLEEGAQPLCETMRYGVSVTDACLGWQDSEQLLREAAAQL